ncbi:MAG TPA: MFS transporter [Candidatus Dormibacteraeota bacterium]
MRRTFSSLAIYNYRLFFISQLVSVTGTWMQSVAQMWLVLHLTGSGVALGVTAALQFLPILLFGTFGGLLADRLDKRLTLIATQTAASVPALVLGAATVSGHVQLWLVYAMAVLIGCVNALDNPTRQSFVSEMVGRARVGNAVSLNSGTFTMARVIGPAVAGLLIGAVGTGWCFLANGFSYYPVVGALLLMRPDELHRSPPVAKEPGQIKAGLRYAWRRPQLRLPLLLMLVVGTLAFNFSVLLPLLVQFVYHSGASTYGVLLSLMGVGSVVGALLVASRAGPTYTWLTAAAMAFGALLLVVAFMPTLGLEFVGMVPLGVAMVAFQATSNSLLQMSSSQAYRGRVMALYVTVFLGTTPVGGPIIGWVAQTFGARTGLAVGGVATLLAGAVAYLVVRRRNLEIAAPDEELSG